ncbi:MAG: hypothetical protein NC213_03230 [Acetobacter sp.]|nr:hypothetical protein [Bacteroides sp.]MCM1340735.1 hypothetical protein [Acetobacter sp.]MCM1433072.1 hypothetical protein [Clostridiales bacterium]
MFIQVEWYICSMLLALVIMYPLLLKNFDFTARVIAPVSSVMIIGYIAKNYTNYPGTAEFDGHIFVCNLRALGCVALGIFCYIVSEKIRSVEFTKLGKISLILIENICWIIGLYFTFSNLKSKYEIFVTFIYALAIAICFSRDFETKVYNNRITYFLGKASLPLYLCQSAARELIRQGHFDFSVKEHIIISFVLTVVLGFAGMLVCDFLLSAFNKMHKNDKYLFFKKTIDK